MSQARYSSAGLERVAPLALAELDGSPGAPIAHLASYIDRVGRQIGVAPAGAAGVQDRQNSDPCGSAARRWASAAWRREARGVTRSIATRCIARSTCTRQAG